MKLSRWIVADVCGFVSSVMLALLVGVAITAVFLRYIAGNPLSWSEEFEIFTLLWIIMTGAVVAKKNNGLLRVDILVNLLPLTAQRFITIITELVHVLVFCLMIYFGYNLAMQLGTKTMPLLGIPLKWMYISLPVGASGMLIITLIQLYDLITKKEAE